MSPLDASPQMQGELHKRRLCSPYFVIYDFMTQELALRGTELLVYAVIFSFCGREGCFRGSQKYIAERLGVSREWVGATVKSLCKKGLLAKGEKGLVCEVSSLFGTENDVKKVHTDREETSRAGVKEAHTYNKRVKKNKTSSPSLCAQARVLQRQERNRFRNSHTHVLLSEEQIESLLSILSFDEFEHYLDVIQACEESGRHFGRSHYRAILEMAAKDREIEGGAP